MSSQLTLTNLSGGTPPFTFYVCDMNGNNCQILGTTIGLYTLNQFYSGANELLIKAVDTNSCEFFTVIPCDI